MRDAFVPAPVPGGALGTVHGNEVVHGRSEVVRHMRAWICLDVQPTGGYEGEFQDVR